VARRRPRARAKPPTRGRPVRLVVGLRNPGPRYDGTRHNVGGDAVGLLAGELGVSFRRAPQGIAAEIADVHVEGHRSVLALPRTFMNESGRAVAPLVRYFGVDLDDLLVAHDDIDLPFAKLRVRRGGSSGGNNGIRSTIRSLRSEDFWRLKIGVGRPPGRMDPAAFVLSRFGADEAPIMAGVVEDAAAVARVFLVDGGDMARQRAGELNARREERSDA